MSAISVTAELSAAATAAATIATAWIRARPRRQAAQDRERSDTVRRLPPGSRVVDLGRHGVIIDVGTRPGGKHGS